MEIRVKDKRHGRFMVDNWIYDQYGSRLGATGLALYGALCRFSSNESQQCWPSIEKLREVTGMAKETIIEAGRLLVELGLVSKEVVPGKWAIYTLLEPTSKEMPIPNQSEILTPPVGITETTSKEMPIQRNLENELRKGTKERTQEVYLQRLKMNEQGLPVFAPAIDK